MTAPRHSHSVTAILTTCDRRRNRVQRVGQILRHRFQRQNGTADRRLWEKDARLVQETARPRPSRQHDTRRSDRAAFGDHGGHRTGGGLDTARRAILYHGRAMFDRALSNQGRRPRRVGDTIAWRPHATRPGLAGGGTAFGRLSTVQHPGVDSFTAREFAPICPTIQFGAIIRQIEQATSAKAQIDADVFGHILPQREALGGQRQFACIPVLLAAPAPVTTGLLGPDAPLFQ